MATGVASGLPTSVLQDARDVFESIDADGTGFIEQSELGALMRNFGHAMSERELAAMMTEADMNADGKVDFEEFASLLAVASAEDEDEDIEAHYRSVFAAANPSGSGEINAAEMQQAMKRMGSAISLAEAQEMISEADTTPRGNLTFRDFRNHMYKLYGEESSWQNRMRRVEEREARSKMKEKLAAHRRDSAEQRRSSLEALERRRSAGAAQRP
eukprot:TRINITY_DN41132_c0_g1_i1.p1 TRINITY_DN41132_c0_g1~~TRINITY_DN41132_c0_g1_i1.p1  ORF type:complete len:231 (+),score=92.26 TRINITY_DN41132_c0_g1_i1:53-694(+)